MSETAQVQIEEGWKLALNDEFNKPYFPLIKQFIVEQKAKGKTVYPPGALVFNAFNLTPYHQLKVVILGQDPYHGPGQAEGLCFSVPQGIKPPPPNHGSLVKWAQQGVLLLNASLTVNAGEANSHAKCGWQTFTDAVIKKISDDKEGIVFLLWGNFARAKKVLIDTNKHFVLEAAHPSPLSGGAFFGSRHFSQTNDILKKQGKEPIDWNTAL